MTQVRLAQTVPSRAGRSSTGHWRSAAGSRGGFTPRPGPRAGTAMPRMEDARIVDAADIARFGQLGIAASVQPVLLRSDAALARVAWGARSEWAFPLGPLIDGGAKVPFGTDAPVEDVDPW